MSSNNTVAGAKFIDAKPVYFPPMESKWSNDDYGNGSFRTSVFHDADGSVGGIPDSYIVLHEGENQSVAVDGTCELKPTWNAAVCTGDIGRLSVGVGGAVGFSFGGGGAGGPGAAAGSGGPAGPGAAAGRSAQGASGGAA